EIFTLSLLVVAMRCLLLLGLLAVTVDSEITCPEGDDANSHDHCVHMETTAMSWSDAEVYCSTRGGHLTSVHNQFDNTAIRSLGESTGCKSYWTGGRCSSGNCSWVDGTSFDFRNWGPGQPDPSYQCISSSFMSGTWSSMDCNQKQCFACETSLAMSDCADWYKAGYRDDGEYSIVLDDVPYKVYCDMNTAGGGWVVFQRRVNGNDSFWDHSWSEYRNGFGTVGPDSNFWLGNEALHQLTAKDTDVTLRIEMRGDRTPSAPDPNAYWWNHYTSFQVGPENDNYPLNNLYLDYENIQGNASTAWYDITYSVGAPFSTIDKINDPRPNCVTKYKMGGWWLRNCALATLNGAYDITDYSDGYGMFWIIDGMDYIIHPFKTAMMLRPTQK
ncbi:hypothetical protein V3C99_004053, partial [Haemonchus contortus]